MPDLAAAPPTDWPDRFEAEYPDDTPAGLAWLEEHLGLDRGRMARLGGLVHVPPAATDRRAAWSAAHAADQERAEGLEVVLTDLIHQFNYDWPAAALFLKRSAKPAGLPLPEDMPADAPLLVAVHTRAAGWTRALADFFGTPTA